MERPQPNRAERGAARQADEADLPDHVSREMTKLGPLIVKLHTACLGNIIALAPVISDLMRHPVSPQVARHILRPQDDIFSLPGLDTITPAELASAIESSMAVRDTAQMYEDVILRHTARLRNAETIVGKLSDIILDFHTYTQFLQYWIFISTVNKQGVPCDSSGEHYNFTTLTALDSHHFPSATSETLHPGWKLRRGKGPPPMVSGRALALCTTTESGGKFVIINLYQ